MESSRNSTGETLVPFCTCGDEQCPFNPRNHTKGCTPCIAKNLREREIPTCFFRLAEQESGAQKPTEGWHFEDFAALISLACRKDASEDRYGSGKG